MATVDLNVIEDARIVEGHKNALAARLEQQFETIARKLFPELNWADSPVLFRVSDGPAVNARIYNHEKPPVLVIDRGLLEFIETEDELAFVIGHEMGHKQIREKLNYTVIDFATKGEEAGADIISVLRGVQAGYNYRAGINFFTRLSDKIKASNKRDVLGENYSAVFDPHPSDGNRIVAIELALANENLFRSGTVRDVPPTPLQGAAAERGDFLTLQHQSFLDRFLPSDYETLSAGDKLEWLKKALETTNIEGRFVSERYMPLPRPQLMIDEIKKIKPAPDDVKARAEAERIIQIVNTVDPYNSKNRFDRFYKVTAGLFSSSPFRLPTLGPFKDFGLAVDDFVTSTSVNRAETGGRLLSALDKVSAYLLPEDDDMMSISFRRSGDRHKSNVIQQTQAVFRLGNVNKRDLYTEAQSSPEVAQVVWRLGGAFDPKFWDVVGPEQLKGLMYVDPYFGFKASNRGESLQKLRRDLQERLVTEERRAAQANVTTFLDNPEAFIFAHASELFPKGNPNLPKRGNSRSSDFDFLKNLGGLTSKFGLARINQSPKAAAPPSASPHREMAERVRADIVGAFESGDTAATAQAMAAISALYEGSGMQTVGAWLYQNGKDDHYKRPRDWYKRSKKAIAASKENESHKLNEEFSWGGQYYDSYSLEPGHPYARLLLDVAPHIGAKKFIELFSKIVEYKNCDEAVLLTAIGVQKPGTIANVLAMRENLLAGLGKYAISKGLIDHLVGLSLQRIIENSSALSLDSDNFLALSRVHGQKAEFYGTQILGPDDIETLHTKLWEGFSKTRFLDYAQTLEPDRLIDIYQFLESNNLVPDQEKQVVLVESVRQRIMALPVAERGQFLERLLIDQTRTDWNDEATYSVRNVNLRDFAITAYAEYLQNQFGQDTGQSAYAA